jgi:putative restriction endonuclease
MLTHGKRAIGGAGRRAGPPDVRSFVGLTERDWVQRVGALAPGDANLWRPHQRLFRALEPGEPYLVKLHAPWSAIVGAGRFVAAERLPLSLAWLAFGAANGVADPADFRQRIARTHPERPTADPTLSCVVLDRPAILDQDDWVAAPDDWRPSVAHGKVYRGEEARALWDTVRERLGARWRPVPPDDELGPGRFRLAVAEAYGRRCAVTGERALAALDVVHVRPPSRGGRNRVDNGLLLRADLARLFAHGLLCIEPDGFVVRLHADVLRAARGAASYAPLDGRSLRVVPERFDLMPSRELLAGHAAASIAAGAASRASDAASMASVAASRPATDG